MMHKPEKIGVPRGRVSLPLPDDVEPSVSSSGNGAVVGSASAVDRALDNIDAVNVTRGGDKKRGADADEVSLSGKTSVLLTKENVLRARAYKRKYGASISGTVNAALTHFFDYLGI